MTRGILINNAGYPYTLTSLMPDNGLANLAGALIKEGHEIKIIDYGVVDLIKRLVPQKYSTELKKIYKELARVGSQKSLLDKINIGKIGLKLRTIDYLLGREMKKNDYVIVDELSTLIEQEKLDYIGFKLWLGDGLDSSIKIANILKRRYPKLKIFAGGPLIDLVKESFYKKTKVFDAIAYGEGEETIIGLANYSIGKALLKDIPNLIYSDGTHVRSTEIKRIVNLNNLPFPVYDSNIYPSITNEQKINILTIDESRGCPYHCAFCPHIDKSGNLWRTKDSNRVVLEILTFIDKYKTNTFRYGGSNPPFSLLAEVAKEIIKRNIKVNYSSFSHVRNMNTGKLDLLRKSGLLAFSFGVESGDDRILKEMILKQSTPGEIRNVLKKTMEADIFTVGSIIFPSPGETNQSRKNTLNLLVDIFSGRDNGSVQVYFPGLYPTSIWGQEPEKFGFTLKDDMDTYKLKYMNYKIKRLFPPSFWKPLPYKIDNKPYKEYIKETEDMIKELEDEKISTMLSDEMFLLAYTYNPQLSLISFRDEVREALFVGDHNKIKNIVSRINKNILTGINKLI